MYLASLLSLLFGVIWVGAMGSENVELRTQLLTAIYETVKDRQLQEGELNLVRNESAGFATSIRSFAEKDAPNIRDGNRVATFDLSMLSEPKSSQVLMQLALKVPTLEYFGCVRYLHLSSDCMNGLGEQQAIATHTLLDEERESEWLQVTIDCNNCNWELMQEVHLVLQLRDDNNAVVAFTDETAADLNSFLILFTQKSMFSLENIREAVRRRKRQADNTPQTPPPSQTAPVAIQNRTTLAEVLERNVTCSRHVVFLTTAELSFNGNVIAPTPGAIKLTYCLGKCSLDHRLPTNNSTPTDPRTQLLIHQLFNFQAKLHPPPCCIPNNFTATELIVEKDDVVDLYTFPNTLNCKCQF